MTQHTDKIIEAVAGAIGGNLEQVTIPGGGVVISIASVHKAARAALQALKDAGYAVVPREPSEAMVEAALGASPTAARITYHAMIAAAEEE